MIKFKKIFLIGGIALLLCLGVFGFYFRNKDIPHKVEEQFYQLGEIVKLENEISLQIKDQRFLQKNEMFPGLNEYEVKLIVKNEGITAQNISNLLEGNNIIFGFNAIPFDMMDDSLDFVEYKNFIKSGSMLNPGESKSFILKYNINILEYKKYIKKEPVVFRIPWEFYLKENELALNNKKIIGKMIILERQR